MSAHAFSLRCACKILPQPEAVNISKARVRGCQGGQSKGVGEKGDVEGFSQRPGTASVSVLRQPATGPGPARQHGLRS
jgi:hypothetical protein